MNMSDNIRTEVETTDLTSTCTICEDGITFYEYTAWNGAEHDRLDGWWSHHRHPRDGHTAEPQPTDAMRALKAEK